MDIKKIAKKKGLTYEQIAAQIGTTKGGLSRALNGNPTLKTLRAVAGVLGVSVVDLFADELQDQTVANGCASSGVCPHCGQPLKIAISCAASPVPEIGTHTQP